MRPASALRRYALACFEVPARLLSNSIGMLLAILPALQLIPEDGRWLKLQPVLCSAQCALSACSHLLPRHSLHDARASVWLMAAETPGQDGLSACSQLLPRPCPCADSVIRDCSMPSACSHVLPRQRQHDAGAESSDRGGKRRRGGPCRPQQKVLFPQCEGLPQVLQCGHKCEPQLQCAGSQLLCGLTSIELT